MNYNYLYKNIGERIEELRKEKNLTQEKLAEKAGLHRAYFWDIENGRNISIKTIYKIIKLGKTNIGKSWMLREILFQALLKKIKCVEFNFEMKDTSIGFRHYKRIIGKGDEDKSYLFPVFDCKSNASNICKKKERKCRVALYNDLGEVPEYGKQHRDYQTCDVCRNKGKDYKLFTWYESFYKRAISSGSIEKGVKAFKMMYGDNLRTVCFSFYNFIIIEYSEITNKILNIFHHIHLMTTISNSCCKFRETNRSQVVPIHHFKSFYSFLN